MSTEQGTDTQEGVSSFAQASVEIGLCLICGETFQVLGVRMTWSSPASMTHNMSMSRMREEQGRDGDVGGLC